MKYSAMDLSKFELENTNVADFVSTKVLSGTKNRAERRKILKALGKVENREKIIDQKQIQESQILRDTYQKELDARVAEYEDYTTEALIDDWKKLTALAALVLKWKYNWNNGRIQSFVEKTNDLHIEMIHDGRWRDILQLLDDECDIQLEVTD